MVVLLLIVALFTVKHYHIETERLAHMLPDAEEKLMKTILTLDLEGDEFGRLTNTLRSKINDLTQKQQLAKKKEIEIKKRSVVNSLNHSVAALSQQSNSLIDPIEQSVKDVYGQSSLIKSTNVAKL